LFFLSPPGLGLDPSREGDAAPVVQRRAGADDPLPPAAPVEQLSDVGGKVYSSGVVDSEAG
jgi:hypothetical protein